MDFSTINTTAILCIGGTLAYILYKKFYAQRLKDCSDSSKKLNQGKSFEDINEKNNFKPEEEKNNEIKKENYSITQDSSKNSKPNEITPSYDTNFNITIKFENKKQYIKKLTDEDLTEHIEEIGKLKNEINTILLHLKNISNSSDNQENKTSRNNKTTSPTPPPANYHTFIDSRKEYQYTTEYNKKLTEQGLSEHAVKIGDKIYETNTSKDFNTNERNYDTNALILNKKNGNLYYSGNIKERITPPNNKTSSQYGIFDISEKVTETIIDYVKNDDILKFYDVSVIYLEEIPKTAQENSAPHAEMKILSFINKEGLDPKDLIMATDKPPCIKCKSEIDNSEIKNLNNNEGNKNPKNWKNPKEINVKIEKIYDKFTIPWYVKLSNQFRAFIKQNFRYEINCNLSYTTILDMYENYNKSGWLKLDYLFFDYGTFSSDKIKNKGAYFKTGIFEYGVGVGNCSLNIDIMTIGGFIQLRELGFSTGLSINLGTFRFNYGPINISVGVKLSCAFSASVDGIELEFFGYGFSYCKKTIGIKTSLIDIQINPSIIIGAILVFLYEFFSNGDNDFGNGISGIQEIIGNMLKSIISFFNNDDRKNPVLLLIETKKVFGDKINYWQECPKVHNVISEKIFDDKIINLWQEQKEYNFISNQYQKHFLDEIIEYPIEALKIIVNPFARIYNFLSSIRISIVKKEREMVRLYH